MVRVEESTDGDMVITTHYAPKDLSEYTEPEKEKVSLDSGLQLIFIDSLDNVMYNNVVNCDTAKQIWEKIEILCEGTEELRSNQSRILVSQYEGFKAKPKEGITKVFEREESEDEQDDQVPVVQAMKQKTKDLKSKLIVERPKIKCFNCDELGHFSTEYRKPKNVKNDKAYLELEAKYEALLKK
ncbi:hypothetical protein AgCh_019775 [Apium graveolens]